MKVTKRREAILKAAPGGMNDVATLCKHFGMSEATVRRGLRALISDRRILRTYGDAAVVGLHKLEAPLEERHSSIREQKEVITRLTQAHIADGDITFLDGGTITAALARHLSDKQVHVVTNNLMVVTPLAAGGTPVMLIGDNVRPSSMNTLGPLAQLSLDRVSVDRVFPSADGVVAISGLCEASADQAHLRECVIRQAAQVIVLATADELGCAIQQHWTPIERPWTLTTDNGAPPDQLEPFHECDEVGVEIVPLD